MCIDWSQGTGKENRSWSPGAASISKGFQRNISFYDLRDDNKGFLLLNWVPLVQNDSLKDILAWLPDTVKCHWFEPLFSSLRQAAIAEKSELQIMC